MYTNRGVVSYFLKKSNILIVDIPTEYEYSYPNKSRIFVKKNVINEFINEFIKIYLA